MTANPSHPAAAALLRPRHSAARQDDCPRPEVNCPADDVNTQSPARTKRSALICMVFLVLGFLCTPQAQAHRTHGLLQASLVEILPSQVGVEVTLVPGMDIAPKFKVLLDTDNDGIFSDSESANWSTLFMARQSVTVDGQSLPLTLQSVRASPMSEMNDGHASIVVHFTATLGEMSPGLHTIVCANRYEPIPGDYQSNGLVPKAPGVRITSHRRDQGQQELTLTAEFSASAAPVTEAAPSANVNSRPRSIVALLWLLGLSAFAIVAGATRRRRSAANAGQ